MTIAALALGIGSLGDVWSSVRHTDLRWVAAAVGFEVLSMSTFAHLQRGVLSVTGLRLPRHSAVAIVYAGNAVAVTLPVAGSSASAAFTYHQYVRRGATAPMASWAMAMAGVFSTTTFALLVAGGALYNGNPVAGVVGGLTASVVVVPVIIVLLGLRHERSRQSLERVGARVYSFGRRLLRRDTADALAIVHQGVERMSSIGMNRRQTVRALTLATMNWVFDALCLWAALQAVGAHLPATQLPLVYAAAVGAATLGLTPAGIGTVEAAIALALTKLGATAASALPAAIVYRAISSWLVLLVGWAVFAALRRASRRQADATPVDTEVAASDVTPATGPERALVRTPAHCLG